MSPCSLFNAPWWRCAQPRPAARAALAPPPLPLAQHDPSSIRSCTRQAAKPCLQPGGPRKALQVPSSPPVPRTPGGSFVWAVDQARATARDNKGRNCVGEGKRIEVLARVWCYPESICFVKMHQVCPSRLWVHRGNGTALRPPCRCHALSHRGVWKELRLQQVATQLPAALHRTGLTTKLVLFFFFDQMKFSRTPNEGFKHPPLPKRNLDLKFGVKFLLTMWLGQQEKKQDFPVPYKQPREQRGHTRVLESIIF